MQDPIVKRIIRLGKLTLFLELLNHLPSDLGPLTIVQLMLSMMQEFEHPLARLFHLLVAVFRRPLQIGHLLFECFGVLDDCLQAIDHVAIRDHRDDDGLKPRRALLHIIIGQVDAKDVGAAFVMRQRPVQTDDLSSAASVVVGPLGAVTLHEGVRVPSRLKDGCMHGATARRITLPHLPLVYTLQRFVRTDDEARDIPTDVLKSLLTTKEVAKRCKASGDRLGYPCDRQHGLLLPLMVQESGLGASGPRAKRPPRATPGPLPSSEA